MMSSPRRRYATWTWALSVSLCALSLGCSRATPGIEFVSYKDPYFPEAYRVRFDECVYHIDADGDTHIAAQTVSEEEGGPVTQWLHVHVFWQPKPGITFANKSTTSATIRYIVATPNGSAIYAGTGFAYPKKARWGDRLNTKIETGYLRLEAQTGDAPEILGDARFHGYLRAREDPHTRDRPDP